MLWYNTDRDIHTVHKPGEENSSIYNREAKTRVVKNYSTCIQRQGSVLRPTVLLNKL